MKLTHREPEKVALKPYLLLGAEPGLGCLLALLGEYSTPFHATATSNKVPGIYYKSNLQKPILIFFERKL